MADGRDGDGKDGRGSGNKLIGAAQVALGVGFFLQGIYRLRSGQPVFALGRAPRQLPAGSVVKHARIEKVANIDERVARIKRLAVKGSVDPAIREEALGVLTRKCAEKWCVAEKDYMGEVSALFWALRDPRSSASLRYTRDHVVIDQFHSAPVLRRLGGGDCDDGGVRLSAWLMAVGYPVKLRVLQAKGESSWSHIYLVTGIPPMRPSRWVALDWSVTTATPGWEALGAKEALQTGRPHGVVARVKDVEITAADFRGLEGTEHSRE